MLTGRRVAFYEHISSVIFLFRSEGGDDFEQSRGNFYVAFANHTRILYVGIRAHF